MGADNATLSNVSKPPARSMNPILWGLGFLIFLAVLITLMVVIFG
jgi:hypothetical protein